MNEWVQVLLLAALLGLLIVTLWGRPNRRGAVTFSEPTHEPPTEVTPRSPARDEQFYRAWAAEKDRIDRHMPDCFGEAGTCLSCGCDRQGRRTGESRPCRSHVYIVAWAKHPIHEGKLR